MCNLHSLSVQPSTFRIGKEKHYFYFYFFTRLDFSVLAEISIFMDLYQTVFKSMVNHCAGRVSLFQEDHNLTWFSVLLPSCVTWSSLSKAWKYQRSCKVMRICVKRVLFKLECKIKFNSSVLCHMIVIYSVPAEGPSMAERRSVTPRTTWL